MTKRFLLLLLIFQGLTTILFSQPAWRPGEMQVSVPADQIEIEAFGLLVSNLKLNSEPAGDFFRCYLTPSEAKALQDAGIVFETEIADLNAWSASFGPRGVPSGYYTVDELNDIADSLAVNFPDICTLHSLGVATGFNQLFALKISDNSAIDENEAEVMFDGGIHGDEIGGPENMIRFARDLCLGYGMDPEITDLVNNREIWIYYCVNPYGRDNMTRYNANGVDINRDGGYMWNGEGNSPAAFSQPETKAYRNFLTDNQFAIHCSYHSGTEFISFPWSYREEPTPDHAIHDFLASLYASSSGYSGIPYGQGFTGMYAINGSTKDFGYGALGSISWSVEISVSKQPPASQIGTYYLKNKPAMLSMVEYAGYGIAGMVTDSVTGESIPATLFINGLWPFANDPEGGDFHKFLLPGNYEVKVVSNGYETRVISGIAVSSMSLTEVNVALPPAGNSPYARRMIACQIPNNNYNDEGNTPAATGPPDQVRYSLGRMGYATLDMGDTIHDAEGNEFIVYENDATPEGYQVLAGQTMDGPWYLLGNAVGNSEFDLSVSGISYARYIKIKDDGDGQSQVADAGFDLDAVEGIVVVPPVDSTGFIRGIVISLELQLPVPGALVSCGNRSTITDEYGFYLIEADTGNIEICAEYWPMYMYGCDSVVVTPGDTLTHNMYIPIQEGINEKTLSTETIKAYPNPADGFTHITLSGEGEILHCEVMSSDGRPVRCNIVYNGTDGITLPTANLTPGVYFVRVFTTKRAATLKLLVLR
ncbi:MAG: M14 family zinc carboxypeptidase [Lentimicrobium sp.]